MSNQKRLERLEIKAEGVVTADELVQIVRAIMSCARVTVRPELAQAFCAQMPVILADALKIDLHTAHEVLQ